MKCAIFANTPAQIHFYKNIAQMLRSKNHKVIFLIRDYRETLALADSLGIDYLIYSYGQSQQVLGSIRAFPGRLLRLMKILREFRPDIIAGFGVYDAYASLIFGKPCIEFTDSEPPINSIYSIEVQMYKPFIDSIITPELFAYDFGKKHIRIRSYKELAYLHKRYFVPRNDILKMIGVNKGESYVILRFNALDAVHDAKIRGFSYEQKLLLVRELKKYTKVFVSCEGAVPKEFDKDLLRIPKNRIHDAIFFSSLLIADTQTMVTEAGILGTPAIRCNSFVGEKDMSNFRELEKRYGLIFNYGEPQRAIDKAIELIQISDLKARWQEKRERLLKEKIDIAAFMNWFIENFPNSHQIMISDPSFQFNYLVM